MKVLAIVGPTGTGKSALADALAVRLNGEIISADSMQVYWGMDIGTAKVPLAERSVAYHCLDLVAPGEPFNASLYQQAARAAIDDILARDKLPLLCGGTGLYLRAALDDLELGRDLNAFGFNRCLPEIRAQLEAEAAEFGAEALHARLAAVDPASAALIHPHNVRRVIRAFEWLEEGSSYAEQAADFSSYHSFYPTCYIGLDLAREQLYPRINARVDGMLTRGLLDEVQTLLDAGYTQALTARQAIGYKEMLPVLSGEQPLATAVEQIKQATRRYAKRQKTWFRRDERIQWLDASQPLAVLITSSCDWYNASHEDMS